MRNIKHTTPRRFFKEPSSAVPVRSTIINESAFVDCGYCGLTVSLIDGTHQTITILVKWEYEDEYYMENGVLMLRTISTPVLIQKPGCFKCWNYQKHQIAWHGTHFYDRNKEDDSSRPVKIDPPISKLNTEYYRDDRGKLVPRKIGKTVYRKKEEFTVVQSGAVNTYSNMDPSTQRRMQRHDRRSTEKVHKEYDGLYGPYNDRKDR